MDDADKKHLSVVYRHINTVQQGCYKLAEGLIDEGRGNLARKLIANSLKHDSSKFHGIEWECLRTEVKESEPERFSMALKQHNNSNPHHPEYWDHINNMPKIYIAEMVCDWWARSTEFGSDLLEWIKESATKRYDFKLQGKTYKEIKYFVTLLLSDPFK